MIEIALIIMIINLPLIAVFLFVVARQTKVKPTIPKLKYGKNGCAHISNKKLRVTEMGDDDEYYLCQFCSEKVRGSELNGISR